jgi:hypothetical protein
MTGTSVTWHWDGSSWTSVPSPSPCPTTTLRAVSVDSPTDAWAVGDCATPTADTPLVEHWNGRLWAQTRGVVGRQPATLTAVDAVSGDEVSVGGCVTRFGGRAFLEQWNGTSWAHVMVPTLTRVGIQELTPTDMWWADKTGNLQHYDGTHWTGETFYGWYGVSAIATDDVWAVGDLGDGRPYTYRNKAEHWDGSAWTLVGVPPGPGIHSALTGVSATSDSDVWAIGRDGKRRHPLGFVTRWNGSEWVTQDQVVGVLNRVLALNKHDIWAIGALKRHGGGNVLHWDGTTWQQSRLVSVSTETMVGSSHGFSQPGAPHRGGTP